MTDRSLYLLSGGAAFGLVEAMKAEFLSKTGLTSAALLARSAQ